MTLDILQRIQIGLDEKRQRVTEFLETASVAEKEIALCADVCCVEDHIHVIDASLKRAQADTLGVCDVCHERVNVELLEMDYTSCVCIDHYSEDERRRLEAELKMSQVVQRALLPQRIPAMPGVEIAAFSRPAEIIGGDYFDFFKFRDGSHGLVIADISGHGVSAGMLMSSLQTAIQTIAPDTNSPSEILQRINRFFIHNINFTTFVTVFLARFDTESRELMYVNSGHNPPAVFSRNGNETNWLKPTAPAIGLDEKYSPKIESIHLLSGDILFLYTDGLTEAFNDDMEEFGAERLAEFIQYASGLSVSEMLQIVRQGVDGYGGNTRLADDLTLVAMKVLE